MFFFGCRHCLVPLRHRPPSPDDEVRGGLQRFVCVCVIASFCIVRAQEVCVCVCIITSLCIILVTIYACTQKLNPKRSIELIFIFWILMHIFIFWFILIVFMNTYCYYYRCMHGISIIVIIVIIIFILCCYSLCMHDIASLCSWSGIVRYFPLFFFLIWDCEMLCPRWRFVLVFFSIFSVVCNRAIQRHDRLLRQDY